MDLIIGKISYGLDAINTFLNSELEKIQKGENSILEIVNKKDKTDPIDINAITQLSFLDPFLDNDENIENIEKIEKIEFNIEFNIKKNYDKYIETNNIADLSLYNKRI